MNCDGLTAGAEPLNQDAINTLITSCSLTPLAARLLVERGYDTPAAASAFLHPDLETSWYDPQKIPGMSDVADKVLEVTRRGGRILIFGDFDVDGISATALSVLGLRRLGADCVGFIPHRYKEGYALSKAAISRALEQKPSLIVTVDCGISCAEEVEAMRQHQIDVCITDHHEASGSIPQSVPLTDPKLHKDCPSRILAGAGVALKLICLLGRRLGMPQLWRAYTDLACLGTIADIMPLVGENRALVADGLKLMKNAPRPGISALASIAHVKLDELSSSKLSFTILPRMNAAGRMGDASCVYDLLLCEDHRTALKLASHIDSINTQRRSVEDELFSLVEKQVKENFTDEGVIVAAGKGWHEGVKGIVAARIARLYKRPALIFTIDDEGQARGSGRSYGNINLFKLVSSCSKLFDKFGGHAAACGVTLPAQKLDSLREYLSAHVDEYRDTTLPQSGPRVDFAVRLSECTIAAFEDIERLAPFGNANPAPVFAVRHVFLRKRKCVGKKGTHLQYSAVDGLCQVKGIFFKPQNMQELLECHTTCTIIFEPSIDIFRKKKTAKLMTQAIQIDKADPSLCHPQKGSVSYRVIELFEGDEDQAAGNTCAPPSRASSKDPTLSQHDASLSCESFVPAKPHEALLSRRDLSSDELEDTLRAAFIGKHQLLSTQKRSLACLKAHKNVLCVMPTGRGKSLIFYLYATKLALLEHKASIFVYPLRALVADQAFHLQDVYASFGLSLAILNGETPLDERAAIYQGLAAGNVQLVLTTPEFLNIHVAEFARAGRVAFLAIDEAHHIARAHAENRSAYAQLPHVLEKLGRPVVLATTATASNQVAGAISSMLNIQERVLDSTVRDNLYIDDRRDLSMRFEYLAHLVASGEKFLVYVNSRSQSMTLCRKLRRCLPDKALQFAFYNAQLRKQDRRLIEEAFRDKQLSCIIATSAFGEGVNITDIGHVVLYHLPFSDIAFNQMSGRAGRDGKDALIHLLFGYKDAALNEKILLDQAPSRADLVALYRALMLVSKHTGAAEQKFLKLTDSELAYRACQIDKNVCLDDSAISYALSIFLELGFLEMSGYGADRRIHMLDEPKHMDLTDSVSLSEGRAALFAFRDFKKWILTDSADNLLKRVNRSILP